jgi:glycosyltransferase involved in cell wall biosynthesis
MVYVQAKYIADKVKHMFSLNYLPTFLPNPVSIPANQIEKDEKPTVLFLGRWDPIKRPDVMLQIAEKLPNVQFVCCGVANLMFKDYFEPLIKKARKLANVNYMGYVVAEKKNTVLNKSWILLNTSSRECLPVSFLEAAAYRMAIVSPNDPDSFASNFGCKIHDKENVKEYVDAINTLILDDKWREKGNAARKYVQETHELKHVIEEHIKIYNSWIDGI